MPTTQEFQRAAEQRFTTAEFLLKHGYTLDAFYLAGYSIECILKTLLMHLTTESNREEIHHKITHGSKMHQPETLKEVLKNLGCQIPLEFSNRFRRYKWSTNLRYETKRRPRGEIRGYLKFARALIHWVEEEMEK